MPNLNRHRVENYLTKGVDNAKITNVLFHTQKKYVSVSCVFFFFNIGCQVKEQNRRIGTLKLYIYIYIYVDTKSSLKSFIDLTLKWQTLAMRSEYGQCRNPQLDEFHFLVN